MEPINVGVSLLEITSQLSYERVYFQLKGCWAMSREIGRDDGMLRDKSTDYINCATTA